MTFPSIFQQLLLTYIIIAIVFSVDPSVSIPQRKSPQNATKVIEKCLLIEFQCITLTHFADLLDENLFLRGRKKSGFVELKSHYDEVENCRI